MGWFSSREEKYGQYIANELHGTHGIFIIPNEEKGQLAVMFVGQENEGKRIKLVGKAQGLDRHYISRAGTPKDPDALVGGFVPYTVIVGPSVYDKVMNALNDALEKAGKPPYPRKTGKKEKPAAVIPGEVITSIAHFPPDLLEKLKFDISPNKRDLIVIVPPEVMDLLSLAKREYLTDNCRQTRTEAGWEFTFKDQSLSRSLVLTLRDRVGMRQREEEEVVDLSNVVEARPGWVNALRAYKGEDPRGLHVVFAAVPTGKGDEKRTVAMLVVRDEDAKERVETILAEANIRAQEGEVDSKLAPQLAKKGIAVTPEARMFRVGVEDAVTELRSAFSSGKGSEPGGPK